MDFGDSFSGGQGVTDAFVFVSIFHHLIIMESVGIPELIILLLVGAIFVFVVALPFWFICKKAGLSPWLSLIVLIPSGVLVLPFVLAFIEWPALSRARMNPPQ